MSDNGDAESEEPAVPLGEGDPVEGAPTARVASRLYFPIEASEVRRREGETAIRTPDGPRDLGSVVEESDEVYFPDRQSLVDAVEDVVGTGAVPTAGDGSGGGGAGDDATTADTSTDPVEPDNAAEAPQGEDTPDEDNAAEAPEGVDEREDGAGADGVAHDEDADEEGAFEFDDDEDR